MRDNLAQVRVINNLCESLSKLETPSIEDFGRRLQEEGRFIDALREFTSCEFCSEPVRPGHYCPECSELDGGAA